MNTYKSDKEKENKKKNNEIKCLLASIAINRQGLSSKNNDLETSLKFFDNTFITNFICNDYLNKKDGVD